MYRKKKEMAALEQETSLCLKTLDGSENELRRLRGMYAVHTSASSYMHCIYTQGYVHALQSIREYLLHKRFHAVILKTEKNTILN